MDAFLLSQAPERLDSSLVAQRQPEASTKPLQPATPTSAIPLQAQYSRPYIAHASIGPSCAIAQWQPLPEETPGASATHGLARQVTLWSHSQGPYNLRTDLALTLGLSPEQVVVQHCEGAGCYGHNGADDVALDAALAARDLPARWRGRPVQLQWMREDESAWEPFGPAAVVQLQAGVTAEGRIVDWQHMWRLGKPIIAAVNGFAMGGGFMMVERTDLRVAASTASVSAVSVSASTSRSAVVPSASESAVSSESVAAAGMASERSSREGDRSICAHRPVGTA
jgi:CO/xanthine dehydrogenase Mo-binding subunit